MLSSFYGFIAPIHFAGIRCSVRSGGFTQMSRYLYVVYAALPSLLHVSGVALCICLLSPLVLNAETCSFQRRMFVGTSRSYFC